MIRFPAVSCALLIACTAAAQPRHAYREWRPSTYPAAKTHAPTPLPERIVLTWNDDPATTQAVTWRTDTSVARAFGELALANANGRSLRPRRVVAKTTYFASDINEANYHSVTFSGLTPDTLYAYRVGDGVNWSEYFHFRTASRGPKPFTFVYFGDAQNQLKTHWSRVFREAFRDAPHAAFTLHAGDLINEDAWDAEWGEWHGAAGWVNGTIPVIATPGNHEYFRIRRLPPNARLWTARDGREIPVSIEVDRILDEDGRVSGFQVTGQAADGRTASFTYDQDNKIVSVGDGMAALTGYSADDLIGTVRGAPPLSDRIREPGTPTLSRHWRPQFSFPVQDAPAGLEETCYYIDYQGARIISLDSSKKREAQVGWLRRVLEDNHQSWTILTFHHPMFSPGRDRDNPELRALWKPLFDEFKVDLVLNGHDHAYARTGPLAHEVARANVPSGYQQAYDPAIGTVYVVSVSGPKMYEVTKDRYAVRTAENTQLYQVIDINESELRYNAYTATGAVYDAFMLEKRAGEPNVLRELLPEDARAPAS